LSKPGKILIFEAIAENFIAFANYAALKIKKTTEIYTHISKINFTKFKNPLYKMYEDSG